MQYDREEIREKYKELFEHSLDLVYVIDLKGNFLDANKITLKKLKYKRKELINLSFKDILDEENLQKAEKNIKEFTQTGRQSSYSEFKVKIKSGDFIYVETFGIPLRKNGEIHSILGIAKDITDLKNAQESLKRSEKKYRDLFESTPFSIVLLNTDGIIVDCNPTLERMFGYKKAEILGRHFENVSIIHQDFLSYLLQLFTKLLKGEEVHRTDIQMYRKDDSLIWTTIQATILKIGGNPFVQVVIHDITKRKNLTQKLLERENLYKTLVRTSPDAIIVTDLKGKIIEASQKAIELYGGNTVVDLIDKNSFDYIHPDDKQKAMENLQKTLNGETIKEEYRFYRKDGTQYFGELSANLIKDADENPKAFIGIIRDITEEKMAEKWLKESEEQYRHLYQNAPISLWTVRIADGKFIRANENAAKIVGYDNLDEFLNNCTSMDIVPADYRKEFMTKLKEKGEITGIEANFVDKKGNEKYITMSAKLYENQGYFEGVSTDITEFKKIQKALQESEDKYRHLFEDSPNMILLINSDGNIVDVNKPLVNQFGFEKERLIGIKFFQIEGLDSKNRELFTAKFKEILEKGFIEPFEVQVFVNETTLKWLTLQASLFEINEQKLVQVILQDINDRKEAEQKLEESEKKYRNIIEDMKDGYFEVDLRGNFTFFNDAFCKLFEYPPEELMGVNYKNFTTEDISKKTFEAFNAVYNTGIEQKSFEYEVITKNGNIIYGETPIHLRYDANGNKIGFSGSLRDITEKKIAENKLKESEEKHRILFKNLPIPTYVWQKVKDSLILIDYNEAAEKITLGGVKNFVGITASELYKDRPDILEDFSLCVEEKIQINKDMKYKFHISKIEKDLKVTYAFVPPDLILVHTEDVSESKKTEQMLKESEERHRLISENANDFIAIFSQLVKFEYVNEVHMKVLGYSKEELIGKSVSQFIHPRDVRLLTKILSDLVKYSEGRTEFRFRKKDGTYIWLDIRGKTFKDKSGELKGITISRNITEKKEAEQRLKDSEEQYRATINSFSDPLHVVDKDLKIILANPAFERWLISLEVDENIVGKSIYEAFSFLSEIVRKQYEQVFSSGIPHFSEESTVIGDREIITESRKIPIFKGDKVDQVVTILRDITAKKTIENKLRESETKYRHLFESAPFLIGLADLDGNLLALNSATNQFITTRKKDELIGKNFREIFSFHEEEKAIIPKAEEQIEKLLKGGVTDFFEFSLVKSDGSIQWVNLNLSLINIEEQTLIQIIMQDITKRKNTEQKLKKSEQKFRRIFESIPDLYFLVSNEGVILDYKGREEDLFLPPENFLGKKMIEIFPKGLLDHEVEAIKKTVETKEPTIIEYSLPIRGEERHYEARILYISKDQAAIFVREITERKKAELLVEEEFEKLKDLEKIRKDLISRVSHELKTPLIPVISGSELLKTVYNNQIGKEAREIIDMIDKGGRRLKDLVEQLLNVSRIEYDKLDIEKQNNNLSEIIKECAKDMKYLIEHRNLTLKLEIPGELWLEIDKNRIGEVITNLLSNAIKYTPPFGKITINLHEKDGWVILSVNDSGVGLTENEMGVLFTRFGKIDRYNEGLEYIDIKGSGLGLYICKEILKLHGGQIWAESEGRNKGSTFIIKLPIR